MPQWCFSPTRTAALFDRRELRPAAELDWILERDMDIARSLADSESYPLHLDVEYVNFDAPAEAFVDLWRCFKLQEPVVRVIESLLLDWGIRPLHLITGQGHHFVWRIGRKSVDWPRVIQELRRNDFHGALVLELHGGGNEAVETVLARAVRATGVSGQAVQRPSALSQVSKRRIASVKVRPRARACPPPE